MVCSMWSMHKKQPYIRLYCLVICCPNMVLKGFGMDNRYTSLGNWVQSHCLFLFYYYCAAVVVVRYNIEQEQKLATETTFLVESYTVSMYHVDIVHICIDQYQALLNCERVWEEPGIALSAHSLRRSV